MPFGAHPAGRALYGYAALLAFENWSPPPDLPHRDEASSRGRDRTIKKLARTWQARDGGFHHVHTLDYTPPPDVPVPRSGHRESGTERISGTWRRAHVRPRVRYEIRDASGRKIGPVYKDAAVLGETYEYRRRWVPRTRIRPDLPLSASEAVYVLDPAALEAAGPGPATAGGHAAGRAGR